MSRDKLTVGWSSIVLNGMDSPARDFSSSSTRAGLVHTEMAGFSSVQFSRSIMPDSLQPRGLMAGLLERNGTQSLSRPRHGAV